LFLRINIYIIRVRLWFFIVRKNRRYGKIVKGNIFQFRRCFWFRRWQILTEYPLFYQYLHFINVLPYGWAQTRRDNEEWGGFAEWGSCSIIPILPLWQFDFFYETFSVPQPTGSKHWNFVSKLLKCWFLGLPRRAPLTPTFPIYTYEYIHIHEFFI